MARWKRLARASRWAIAALGVGQELLPIPVVGEGDHHEAFAGLAELAPGNGGHVAHHSSSRFAGEFSDDRRFGAFAAGDESGAVVGVGSVLFTDRARAGFDVSAASTAVGAGVAGSVSGLPADGQDTGAYLEGGRAPGDDPLPVIGVMIDGVIWQRQRRLPDLPPGNGGVDAFGVGDPPIGAFSVVVVPWRQRSVPGGHLFQDSGVFGTGPHRHRHVDGVLSAEPDRSVGCVEFGPGRHPFGEKIGTGDCDHFASPVGAA